jgi:hypothetical protein
LLLELNSTYNLHAANFMAKLVSIQAAAARILRTLSRIFAWHYYWTVTLSKIIGHGMKIRSQLTNWLHFGL